MDGYFLRPTPKQGEIYRHFKGNRYKIIAVAVKEDTGEKLVIYQALYGEGGIWARNLDVFMSEIDRDKYPEAAGKYRFELEGEESRLSEEDFDRRDEYSDDEQVIHPLLEKFLDADSSDDKLMILLRMHDIINDGMIDTIAVSLGVEVEDGPVEERYNDLLGCLRTISRYEFEGDRLR